MTHPIKSPRKLIEVALPLDAINVAAAREIWLDKYIQACIIGKIMERIFSMLSSALPLISGRLEAPYAISRFFNTGATAQV